MPETRYDDLRALYVNCTLERSPEPSNTEGLVDVSRRILAHCQLEDWAGYVKCVRRVQRD